MSERIFFQRGQQQIFLQKVKMKTQLSFLELGKICKKHQHTINDWYHEKCSMPYDIALKLSKISKIPLPKNIQIKNKFWYTSLGGKIGGKVVQAKHGNSGTSEGRSLGGKRSILTHKIRNTAFKQRKNIMIPRENASLAELFGIILGDGGMTAYQLTITLDRITDKPYAKYVLELIEKTFSASTKQYSKKSVINIVTSSKSVIEFLIQKGLKCGSKVKNQIDVPLWIKKNKEFSFECVKGLIDTDGCVYIDKHIYKGKLYKHLCLDFTNVSTPLLDFVWEVFTDLKLKPKLYGKSIKLRRLEDIKVYFRIIKSSNPKHNQKFTKFLNGEIA